MSPAARNASSCDCRTRTRLWPTRTAPISPRVQLIVPDVDRIPPVYHAASDEPHYTSDYREGGYRGPDYVVIDYWQLDPDALRYSCDPENPPKWTTDPVLGSTTDELTWADDAGRAVCRKAILTHRNGVSSRRWMTSNLLFRNLRITGRMDPPGSYTSASSRASGCEALARDGVSLMSSGRLRLRRRRRPVARD